jgi:hypothetical protein
MRKHADDLVERQPLEPEPGSDEDTVPSEIERDRG